MDNYTTTQQNPAGDTGNEQEEALAQQLQAELEQDFLQQEVKYKGIEQDIEESMKRMDEIEKEIDEGEKHIDGILGELDKANQKAEQDLDQLMSDHIEDLADEEEDEEV